ncbi:hypothetical protein BCR44DRAFT_1205587 [Catenaria anguillulae PL171]|uniref:Uncharacterized protein n=1 Tax=Catenaria anguillulae PL171 TaxID=765915 RepID=A0A1Y2HHR8_9FUNG|nr:hypothetical protein BCR44DRAFT_1205587 [Catenaria anguillulae PL171]
MRRRVNTSVYSKCSRSQNICLLWRHSKPTRHDFAQERIAGQFSSGPSAINYVRSELLPFMIESMRPIISANMALLSDCDSDATRGSGPPATGSQEENLRQVTVAVISALLQSSQLVPIHIRRLLTFLHAKIESSIALLRKTHRLSSPTTPSSPTSTIAAALPLPRSRESSSRSVAQSSTQSTGSRTHAVEPNAADPTSAPAKPDPHHAPHPLHHDARVNHQRRW